MNKLTVLLLLCLAPAATAATLEPCELPGTTARARCGSIEVLENRRLPEGRRIPIRVVVFPARGAAPAGDPLFVIPGGPGQSATEFAGFLLGELAFATDSRDIVFVDQRGTGGSNPLHCAMGDSLQDIVRLVSLGVDGDLEAVRTCRQALGRRADLRQYTTSAAVADLEAVRAALGYERINLFAVSYGTRVALAYMRQHRERVRAALFRAAAGMDLELLLTATPDAERALERVFAACAADDSCRRAYPDPRGDLERALARLAKAPVTASVVDPRSQAVERVQVNDDVLRAGISFLLYVTEWSSHIPRVAHAAARGDVGPVASLVVPVMVLTATPVHWGMRRSVLCAEDVARVSRPEVEDAGAGSVFGAADNVGLVRSCAEWPVGDVPEGFQAPVRSDVPTLIISGEEDPILPPHRAQEVARHLTRSRHIVVPGVAHGPNFPGCVRGLAAAFLAQGHADGLDGSCVQAIERPPFAGAR